MKNILLILSIFILGLLFCVTAKDNYYGFYKINFAGAYLDNDNRFCFEAFRNKYTNNEVFNEINEWFVEGCKGTCQKINRCPVENIILIIKGEHKGNIIEGIDVPVSYDVITYCYKNSYKTSEEAKNNCWGKKNQNEYNLTYYER
jgi:hypothetical protein